MPEHGDQMPVDWGMNLRPQVVEIGNKLDELIAAFNALPEPTPAITWDDIYPVGSIYINATDPTDPGTKFGGRWKQLTNIFLRGMETPNTGGSDSVTLTEANMPEHNHPTTFNGTAAVLKPTATFTGTPVSHNHTATFTGTAASHGHPAKSGAFLYINPKTGLHTTNSRFGSNTVESMYMVYRDSTAQILSSSDVDQTTLTPTGTVHVDNSNRIAPLGTVKVNDVDYTPEGTVTSGTVGENEPLSTLPNYQGVYMWQREE